MSGVAMQCAGEAETDGDAASLLFDRDASPRSSGASPRARRRLTKVQVFAALGLVCGIAVLLAGTLPDFPRRRAGRGRGADAAAPDAKEVVGLAGVRDLVAGDLPTVGTVDGVYTYGAPATSHASLTNGMAENGCFNGLRSFTEDVLSGNTKQVDAAAISNFYPHARIATAVLHADGDSVFVDCPGEPSWPNDNGGNVFGEWRLHWENDYAPRLRRVSVKGKAVAQKEPFASASKFVTLAYKCYDTTAHTKEAMVEKMPGWRLVARETLISGSGLTYDEDPVMLAQDSESLECALAFTGTNNVDNELTSSTTSYSTGYCGFEEVHAGYRNELWTLTKNLWPRLRPKLSKCAKVSCVGHSLGGSLCEVFSACANSKRISDADYQQQMWATGTAEALPEIERGGVVYADDAEHRCGEPPCPKLR